MFWWLSWEKNARENAEVEARNLREKVDTLKGKTELMLGQRLELKEVEVRMG